MMNRDRLMNRKENFYNYFKSIWGDSKPLAKLFRTATRGYLYDTGTNKIFACNDLEFTIIERLLKYELEQALDFNMSLPESIKYFDSIDGIREIMEDKNALKTVAPISFKYTSLDMLYEAINQCLGMILLEVTERCNLRCAYCIYGPHYKEKRNHGTRDMDPIIAHKAIDHLARSCDLKDKVGITFYGGEPLLCTPLIKSCVEYAKRILPDKKLGFSITTNATLMTPDIGRFLFKEGFSVRVSIDGPQEIHDEYRKDIQGKGTFDRTLSGLKTLCDIYGQDNNKVGLSMVLGPPYTPDRVSQIAELWNLYSWLPKKSIPVLSYAQGYTPNRDVSIGEKQSKSAIFDWASKCFRENYRAKTRPHPIAANVIESELVHLVQRQAHSGPIQAYSLNGCCVPASRKQFITVDGTIVLCERIGMAPSLGDVNTGIDMSKVMKTYLYEYSNQSLPSCSECWALQLCTICYLHTFSNNEINIKMKNYNCSEIKILKENYLQLYSELVEIDKDGLDYLLEWEIS